MFPLPCMLVCSFVWAIRTRDRGCSKHPVFPALSNFRGGKRGIQAAGDQRRESVNCTSICSRMSEARCGTTRTPPRISLRSSGRQSFCSMDRISHHVIASAASNRALPLAALWIAHMGVCVSRRSSHLFARLRPPLVPTPRAVQDGARRSSQGRPISAAAQRLDLELSEHAIMLGRSGPIGAPGVGQCGRHLASSHLRSKVRAGSAIWVACQIGTTFGRRARRLPKIPLAAGRLERTRPFFVAAFEAMQSIGSSTRIFRG